jgi:mannose-6-phosphate isomerase-like protein (cupin superfamily)
MPVIKREEFGTSAVADWMAVRGGICDMGCSSRTRGQKHDPHFHDCDQFEFPLSGKARITTGGTERTVGRGDVICSRKGEVHGILEVIEEPYVQVWIKCNLSGRGRIHSLVPGLDEP